MYKKIFYILTMIILIMLGLTSNIFAKPTIAYMLPNVGPIYTDRWYAAAAKGTELGYEMLMYNAGGYSNINTQITQVENLIERKVDGIIIHATSSTALTEVLERAVNSGIKVVCEYVPVKSEKMTFPLIGLDAFYTGRLCAVILTAQMGGRGNIIALPGPPGHEEASERWQGFTDYISLFPQMKVVGLEWTVADIAVAIRSSENMLTANPKVDGIYTWYDLMSQGMVSAMKARNMKPVPHVTCDLSVECEKLIREGWITATEAGAPLATARAAVELVNKLIKGEKVDQLIVKIPPTMITKEVLDVFDRKNIVVSEDIKSQWQNK
jgi:ribose transport system substrate-binding protein